MKFTEDFDLSQSTHTGGQTGSRRVRAWQDDAYYQYKPSILSNKISRRIKARSTDRENFGEVISSFIGRALLSSDVVPEVSLVYDRVNKRVAIASRYLGEGRTLDDFAFKELGIPRSPDRNHVLVTSGVVKTNDPAQLSLDQYPQLPKSDICDSLALAAMVGDNDVNPGNLVVLGKAEPYRVARIDLGHAFGDLLNAPETFGGGLRFPENPVLDFFNRTHVAGLRLGGDPSKLKRDYLGVVPSMEMVSSLRKMSKVNYSRLASGIENARKEFDLLVAAMRNNGDVAGLKHVRDSLAAIYRNLTAKSPNAKLSAEEVMDLAFNAIRQSTLKNIEDAKKVANVMELQLEIAAAVTQRRTISERALYLINEGNFPKNVSDEIMWVSVDSQPGFKGSIYDYSIYVTTKNKENSPSQNKSSRVSFRDFKARLQKSIPQAHQTEQEKQFFKKMAVDSLRNDLLSYIEIVEKEQDVSVRLSGFRKEEKINAAQALIDVLQGKDPKDLRQYLPVLNNGRLGKKIKDAIRPYGVGALVRAAEEKHIRPADPPLREAFHTKP